ncbi:hypothetical protein DFH11DRAFT_1555839 [Phellopilus nigrolimitatus]|nr:hypothetical protein DFH11DRAFT_1555839 [Phellopilus nigrolimitatus]
MVNDTVDNQIVVAERETAPGSQARVAPSINGMHGSNIEVNVHDKPQLPVHENELDMVNDTVDNQIVVEHETAPGSQAQMAPFVNDTDSSSIEVNAHGKSQLPVNENALDMVNNTVDNQTVVTEHEMAPDIGTKAQASETTPARVPIQIVNPLFTSRSKSLQLSQPLACQAPIQTPTSTCMGNTTTMNLLPNLLCPDGTSASCTDTSTDMSASGLTTSITVAQQPASELAGASAAGPVHQDAKRSRKPGKMTTNNSTTARNLCAIEWMEKNRIEKKPVGTRAEFTEYWDNYIKGKPAEEHFNEASAAATAAKKLQKPATDVSKTRRT